MNMRDGHKNEILFDELHENDTVVIKTENSVYEFRVAENRGQMGVLEGGALSKPREVAVGGTMGEESFLDDRLRVGGRAMFFATENANTMAFKRIVTSQIEALDIEPADHFDGRRAA
jgi:hypothetical protein